MLISTSYLPPIWYISKIRNASELLVEAHEHFIKQTIRNRCHILSPNGVQQLIVPVVHDSRTQKPVKDIRIANDFPWQRQHWRSLEAAYRRSAYFEFYTDDFIPFYTKPYSFLMDFNLGLLRLILDSINIKTSIVISQSYEPPEENNQADFRQLCNTGKPFLQGDESRYPQVFAYKNDFVPGLSFMDLLCNMGPASSEYLLPNSEV